MDVRAPDKYVEIDNPGAGDCAFYAFAISLISHIRGLKTSNPKRAAALQNKLFANIQKSSYELCRARIVNFDFHNPNREFLLLLNNALRTRLYNLRITSLNKEFVDTLEFESNENGELTRKLGPFALRGESIFSDAMEVFYHIYNSSTNSAYHPENNHKAWFNDFYRDKNIRHEIAQIVAHIIRLEDGLKRKMSGEEIESHVGRALFTDRGFLPKGELAKFSTESLVGKSLLKKKERGTWGTYEDLNLLAEFFDVNLVAYSNGCPPSYMPVLDDRPTITLNHLPHVFHWTTLLDPFHGNEVSESIIPFKRFFM